MIGRSEGSDARSGTSSSKVATLSLGISLARLARHVQVRLAPDQPSCKRDTRSSRLYGRGLKDWRRSLAEPAVDERGRQTELVDDVVLPLVVLCEPHLAAPGERI